MLSRVCRTHLKRKTRGRMMKFGAKVKLMFWIFLLFTLGSLILAAFEFRTFRKSFEQIPKLLDEVEQEINWRKL